MEDPKALSAATIKPSVILKTLCSDEQKREIARSYAEFLSANEHFCQADFQIIERLARVSVSDWEELGLDERAMVLLSMVGKEPFERVCEAMLVRFSEDRLHDLFQAFFRSWSGLNGTTASVVYSAYEAHKEKYQTEDMIVFFALWYYLDPPIRKALRPVLEDLSNGSGRGRNGIHPLINAERFFVERRIRLQRFQ